VRCRGGFGFSCVRNSGEGLYTGLCSKISYLKLSTLSFVFSFKTEYSILLIHILCSIFTTAASVFLRISPSWPTQSFLITSLPTPTHPPLTPPHPTHPPLSLPFPLWHPLSAAKESRPASGVEARGGTHGRTRTSSLPYSRAGSGAVEE
jgi:hypothetical protein